MQAGQFNPIRFFADKRARQWDKTFNEECASIVTYETGTVPSFCLLVDTDPQDPSPTFVCELYNTSDELIYTIESYGTNGFETYQQINYLGVKITGETDGYYYLKATIGSDVLYSDVFAWSSDVSELMKFEVSASDVRLGNRIYNMMNAASQTFYIHATYIGLKPKIDQDGDDQDAITRIIWGSRSVPREYNIDATESMYIYLSALGMVKANGLVKITFGYETFTASDIVVEEIENHSNGLYQVKLTFSDESETVSVKNG